MKWLSLLLTCTAAAATIAIQDPKLTPGVVDPACTVKKVCTPGYTSTVRNVSEATKKEVCRAYKKTDSCPKGYEIDHLISLELCGANDVKNLWPEPYCPLPRKAGCVGAREKDRVETALHKQICSGRLSLEAAQKIITGKWPEYLKELP